MNAYATPLPSPPRDAFIELCQRYDGLLADGAPALEDTARTDLRAFARLFDMGMEDASEADVWVAVRRRLEADLAPALQGAAEWVYEEQKQAA
ncbi:hypothetical protein [Phenylobacterium sp.]|uniref:hypothetical protein n=1 Tax=Phenylobacterium sp. TaxID=1871053 RepID=UPI00273012F6|nr:hypothetical protein [Phenylobacterium sp.]MDP1616094.1 hypothetical protein [Phenylobacterium sp.]MDP1986345.1 hypothetical protein [Phenylobacterium sp.]